MSKERLNLFRNKNIKYSNFFCENELNSLYNPARKMTRAAKDKGMTRELFHNDGSN